MELLSWKKKPFPEDDLRSQNVSAAGISFIKQLLAACPPQRPSAADALTDPWLKDLSDFYSNGNTDALSKSPVNGEALPSRMPKQGNLKTEMPFGSSPSHVLWKTTDVTKESGKIQFLLDHGFDIHSPGFDADKALLCVAPMDYEVTMFLLARGANIDAKLDNGETALRFAARHGNEDTLLGLLMEGADVNAKTENGTTPLHCAAMAGHMRVVRLLLRHRADKFQKDCQNRTAFDLAKENGHQEVADLFRRSMGID